MGRRLVQNGRRDLAVATAALSESDLGVESFRLAPFASKRVDGRNHRRRLNKLSSGRQCKGGASPHYGPTVNEYSPYDLIPEPKLRKNTKRKNGMKN